MTLAGMLRIAGLMGALGAALLPAGAAARPGDLYVSDSDQDQIVRINGRTGAPTTLAPNVQSPAGLHFAADGMLYVASYQGSGFIYRVNPRTGDVSTVESGPPLAGPTDVVELPGRRLFATDPFAGTDNEGAVFTIARPSGPATILSQGDQFAGGPLGIDALPNGALYVVDQDAGSPPDSTGAVIRIDPRTGAQTVVNQGGAMTSPYGFVIAPNRRTAYVPDQDTGSEVFRVNLATGARSVLTSGAPLDFPGDAAVAPGGSLFVSNLDDPNIIRVNTRTGAKRVFSTIPGSTFTEGIEIEPPRCGGKVATIVGTRRADKLRGSRFGDVIAALGGRDTVRGLAGKDLICGGAKLDRLLGGPGPDRLIGGGGNDVCRGGPGRDRARRC